MSGRGERGADVREALDALFNPKAVTLVGLSSRDERQLGNKILRNLVAEEFPGPLHLVHPTAEQIDGQPCVASISEVVGAQDVALLMLSEERIPAALHESADAGCRAAIVFASAAGSPQQFNETIRSTVAETGMRVLGPNCAGVWNRRARAPLTFARLPKVSNATGRGVAYVGHSGGILAGAAIYGASLGLLASHFVGTGNEADLGVNDVVEYLLDDPDADVVACYLEQLRHPERFLSLVSRDDRRRKPVVICRVGATEQASQAARSHTSAIVGDVAHQRVFLEACGVVSVDSLCDLSVAASALRQPKPTSAGVAVVTASGGAGALLADLFTRHGLVLPAFSASARDRIHRALSPFPFHDPEIMNPIDVGTPGMTNADVFAAIVDAALDEPDVGVVVVVVETGAAERVARVIDAGRSRGKVVVAFALMQGGPEEGPLGSLRALAAEGLPVFSNDRDCAVAVRALVGSLVAPHPTEVSHEQPPRASGEMLSADACQEWLRRAGLTGPSGRNVATLDDALEAATEIGYPIALKVADERIVHKTDVGGVRTALTGPDQFVEAWHAITASVAEAGFGAPRGFVVESHVRGRGTEWLVGVRNDFELGPIVVVGLGGVLAEAIADVAASPAPFSPDQAKSMILRLRCSETLQQRHIVDGTEIATLASFLAKLSDAAWRERDVVAEIDLNPTVVTSDARAVALDCRVLLRERPSR